ncbi:ATP synthase F1 subunit delta [bacterium]|nr:ATP synthase F1 subunit delta [bacterium]
MDKITKITKISKNYAHALIDLGYAKTPDFEKISEDLNIVKSSMTPELYDVLVSPTIADDKKVLVFSDVFSGKIDENILKFFTIIIKKSRFNEFENIINAYFDELDLINNIKNVEITSAVELEESQKSEIVEKLQNKIKKNVKPLWNVNESIIAGLVIKIDDDVIDLSVDTKLKSLSKNIR